MPPVNMYFEEADRLLRSIAGTQAAIAQLKGEYQIRVDRIKKQYEGEVAEGKAELARLEKKIRAFSKKYKNKLFADQDSRTELNAGALLYTVQERVKQAKGMLDTLEKCGREELIKTIKRVNWDAFEPLDDDELESLGTCRVKKEIFEYELK